MKVIENDEHQWEAQFAASREMLEVLADRALAEYSKGLTELLDIEKLSKL